MQANGTSFQPAGETAVFSFSVYDAQITSPPTDPPESKRQPIFDRLMLTEADVGKTIYVSASDRPGAVALLTNGVSNVVKWQLEAGNGLNGGIFTEYPFLTGTYTPPNRADFAGKELSAIGVRVDRLRLNDPAPGMYDFSLTLVTEAVPEPSGPALLAALAPALLRRRRCQPVAA
jgi:hypothetical protein